MNWRKLNVSGPGGCALAACLVGSLALAGGCRDNCVQSRESPSTEGNCEEGQHGDVCVQEIENVALTSTYTRWVDFASSTLTIDLTWCPDADCSDTINVGRAIQ